MLPNEHLQLPYRLGVAPQGELSLEPLLQRADAKLLEAAGLSLSRGVVAELLERLTAPELKRRLQPFERLLGLPGGQRPAARVDQALGLARVDGVVRQPQPVPARHGLERFLVPPRLAQGRAQARYLDIEPVAGAVRWFLPPERLHDAVARQDLSKARGEQGQKRALFGPAHGNLPPVRPHLDRP